MKKNQNQTNKKVLLLGNGINLLDDDQSVSWGTLLRELKKQCLLDDLDLGNDFKPFPLAFEEMLHRVKGNDNLAVKARRLKESINNILKEQMTGKSGFNEYHKKIMLSNVDEILTTNYDYGLEKSVLPDFENRKRELANYRMEIRHSQRRAYSIPGVKKRVWHIHGELDDSRNLTQGSINYHQQSVMIGYEHYAICLEKIQEEIRGKGGIQKPENQSLALRIKNGYTGIYWIDYFFTNDIYMLGFGLDFSENHLWWLINLRANILRGKEMKNLSVISNTITFLLPEIKKGNTIKANEIIDETSFEKWFGKRAKKLKQKAITDILPAFNVNVIPIKASKYTDFYDIAIRDYLN
jgi:hypothetical protein